MVDAQIEYSALLRNPSEVEPPCRTEKHTFIQLTHILFRIPFYASLPLAQALTKVLRVDEGSPSLAVRAPSPARSPAALSVIKLPAGNVHLVQDGVHTLGEHAGTVGVQVEAAFVADDGLVDAALVALALVVGLRNHTKSKTTKGCVQTAGKSDTNKVPSQIGILGLLVCTVFSRCRNGKRVVFSSTKMHLHFFTS